MFAVVLAVIALLIGLWLVRETIVWLVAAGFLAFSIEPLVRIFQRRGMGRGKSTACAFVVISAILLFFAYAIIPQIADGARALKEKIPEYVEQLQDTDASDSLNADDAVQSGRRRGRGRGRVLRRTRTRSPTWSAGS